MDFGLIQGHTVRNGSTDGCQFHSHQVRFSSQITNVLFANSPNPLQLCRRLQRYCKKSNIAFSLVDTREKRLVRIGAGVEVEVEVVKRPPYLSICDSTDQCIIGVAGTGSTHTHLTI